MKRLMTWLLVAEAFASGFIGSLELEHTLWHLGRSIERARTSRPCADGSAGTAFGALGQRIWHLWF